MQSMYNIMQSLHNIIPPIYNVSQSTYNIIQLIHNIIMYNIMIQYYILYVDFEHPQENDLFEVYRITTITVSRNKLIVNKIAVFKNEN